MNKRFRIASIVLFASVCSMALASDPMNDGKVPLDTILVRNADRISNLLDNPATYDEAHWLIDKSMKMPGAKESKVYPILRLHQSFYHNVIGDKASQKAILLELWDMLPIEISAEISIYVPHSLAIIYRREGKIDSALYYYDKALQAAQEQDNLEWKSIANLNIGVLHHSLGQLAEAEVFLDQTTKDVEKTDDPYSEMFTLRVRVAIGIGVILLSVTLSMLWWRLKHNKREAQLRISTLEQERRRLAKELHDGLCNDMLALEMEMQVVEPFTSPLVKERLHELREQARQISHQLMPPEFTYLNLNQLLGLYATAMAKSLHVTISYSAIPTDDDTWKSVNETTASNVYRIVQEQIANIIKGRTAKDINISLSTLMGEDYDYRLSITDDGNPIGQGLSTGLGNRTLRDRVTSISAHLNTSRHDGINHFVLDFNKA